MGRLRDKVVLITGAAGAIGSLFALADDLRLVRQVVAPVPRRSCLFRRLFRRFRRLFRRHRASLRLNARAACGDHAPASS